METGFVMSSDRRRAPSISVSSGLFLALVTTPLAGVSAPAWAARTISMDPSSGPKGTTITVTGKGFTKGNKVTVKYDGCNSVSNTAIDDKGEFETEIVANCEKDGKYSVQAFEYDSNDNFIAKSNNLAFTQKGGGRKFLSTALKYSEAVPHGVVFVLHDEKGKIFDTMEDTICLGGQGTPDDCGALTYCTPGYQESAAEVKIVGGSGDFIDKATDLGDRALGLSIFDQTIGPITDRRLVEGSRKQKEKLPSLLRIMKAHSKSDSPLSESGNMSE